MTIPTIEHYDDARRFLERLRPSNWPASDIGQAWIFRGQGLANTWKLLPSAYRDIRNTDHCPVLKEAYLHAGNARAGGFHNWENMIAPPNGMAAAEWLTKLEKAAYEAYAHAYAVRHFVLLSDRVKLPISVPEALWHFPNHKYSYLASLVKGATGVGKIIDAAFAVAQHHGVQTPLLDWSYNPLTAAYFATEDSLKQGVDEPLAVWALDEQYLNMEDSRITRLTIRSRVTPFLDAQQGLFTWHPSAYLDFNPPDFLTFDSVIALDIAALAPGEQWLYKVTLEGNQAKCLFNLLARENITRAHLMPGFNSVTATLELRAKWYDPTI